MSQVPFRRIVVLIKGFSKTAYEYQLDCYYLLKYIEYFKNVAGGAFEDNEILIIKKCSVDMLKKMMVEIRVDFAVIVYIGHGATQDNNQLFQLSENEIIKPGQFVSISEKVLVILESCRCKTNGVYTIDLTDKIPKFRDGGVVRCKISKEESRRRYIEQIKKCHIGLVVCFACSEDEEALDYIFTTELLEYAMNWYSNRENYNPVLSIVDVMKYIPISLSIFKPDVKQHPVFIGVEQFPFVISRY